MNKLYDFFFTDRKCRWRTYVVSSAVAVVYASVNLLVLKRDEKELLFESGILLCSLVALSVLYYVFLRKAPVKVPSHLAQHRLLHKLLSFAGTAGAVFLIASQGRNVPKLQAAIVAMKLDHSIALIQSVQAASKPQSQLQARFRDVSSIANTIDRYRIPVDPGRLRKVEKALVAATNQPALSEQAKQVAWSAAAKLDALAAVRNTEANTKSREQAGLGYVLNSVLSITDMKVLIKGDHSPLIFGPGGGAIDIRGSTVVFDGIDFKGHREGQRVPWYVLVVADAGSSVVVRNAVVEDVGQSLDRMTWVDVEFRRSIIFYRGGPVALANVSFKDCDLHWLELYPVGWDLRERIIKADGQPISFVSEGFIGTSPKPPQ